MVQWRRQYPNPETPYDFKVMSNVTSPHSGNQLASVTYTKGSIGYATWFNQFISLCPSTLYNFNAVSLAIAPPSPTTLLSSLALSFVPLSSEASRTIVPDKRD